MAVLIEAISVVVRQAALSRFSGGPAAFLASIPNRTACHDDHLVRVGFMDTTDADAYLTMLQQAGLTYWDGEQTVDFAVVIQAKGPTQPSPWLAFEYHADAERRVSLAWLAGTTSDTFSTPPGWAYEGSLSAGAGGFLPSSAVGDRLKFLRSDNDVEVYLDLQTNQEVFVGRSTVAGDSPAAVQTQLRAIVNEAFAIEAKGPVPRPRFWQKRDPRYVRLADEMLPTIRRLTAGPGRAMMAAHLAEGIVQRLLGRLPAAEKALRTAHATDPTALSPLRDLVRCLAEQKRPREALPFARKAAELDPADAAVLGNLAASLMQCGQFDEALAVIDRALEIDPDDAINHRIRRRVVAGKA